MRHRRLGRVLGRSPSHRKAMFRNLIKALFLTEETDERQAGEGAPKIKGRIVTTLQKAKEVRPMVEKCITIAKKALVAGKAAEPFATTAERNSEGWQKWRQSEDHKKWSKAMSPVVTARRRVAAILGDVGDKHSKGDKRAVRILFEVIAPRFADRQGGYCRILKLAKPRLGDAGARAILEFVGKNDRAVQKAPAPSFEGAEAAK